MKKLLLVIILLLVFGINAIWAQELIVTTPYTTEFEAGYWFPSIGGSVKYWNRASVHFKDDLGIGNNGSAILGFKYILNNESNLQLSYFSISNTGSRFIPNQFSWRARVFQANDSVNSSIKVSALDFLYEKSVYQLENSMLAAGLGFKWAGFNVDLNNITQGFSVSQSLSGLIPQIGLSGTSKIAEQIDAIGKINFATGDSAGRHGSMVDLLAGLRWNIHENWAADFGYKWFQLKGKNNNSQDEVDFNYGGPIVTIKARF